MHELLKKEISEKKEIRDKQFGLRVMSHTPLMGLYVIKKNLANNKDEIIEIENIRESWYNYLLDKNNKLENNHMYNGLLFMKENLVEIEGFRLSYYLVNYQSNTSDLFLSFNVEKIHKRICEVIDEQADECLSSYKSFKSLVSNVRRFVRDSSFVNESLLKDEYHELILNIKKNKTDRSSYIGLKNGKDNKIVYVSNLNENQAFLIKHIKKLHSLFGYGEIKLSMYDRHNEKEGGEEIEITDNIKLKICELISLTSNYRTNFRITFTGTKRFNGLYPEIEAKIEDKIKIEKENGRRKMEERREERLLMEANKLKEDSNSSYSGGFGISN
jgi:hypothetical protein